MSYLSNFSLSEAGKDIAQNGDASILLARLSSEAYFLCKVYKKENPSIEYLEELIGFMLQELDRAGDRGAEWFRASIEDGSIADNDYTRAFCTRNGYVEKEGVVEVLLQCSHESDCINWEESPSYVRDLPYRYYPGFMMGAFALYRLNQIVDKLKSGAADAKESLMDDLEVVVDALVAGKFNDGWASCEQMFEDDKKANGHAGAKARNKKYSQTREWVLAQYSAGSWPSPRAASIAIAPKAIEFAKNLGKPLSEQRAQVTVYEWLLAETKASRHHEGQENFLPNPKN